MRSGVVAVGLFATTSVAGVVGAIGASDDEAVERVGTILRMLLPTDACGVGRCTRSGTRRALVELEGHEGQTFPFLSAHLRVA